MNVEATLAVATVVQAIGTVGYLYVTYKLLTETARGVATSSVDQAARFAPHLTVDAKLEIAIGGGGATVVVGVANRGLGPAIATAISVSEGDVRFAAEGPLLTTAGAIAILQPGSRAPFRGRGAVVEAGGPLSIDVTCEDMIGSKWHFCYNLAIPVGGGAITSVFTALKRPGKLAWHAALAAGADTSGGLDDRRG